MGFSGWGCDARSVCATIWPGIGALAADAGYRQATDLGEWYRWKTVLASFEQEEAFYREQAALGERGADVVYLGLDGAHE